MEYKMEFIGQSDISALVMVGFRNDKGIVPEMLYFGCEGRYSAFICDGEVRIANHFKLVAEYNSWLNIYDDKTLVKSLIGGCIKVYRAGESGCIIQIMREEKQ
jgi:hypothetical protein